MHSCKRETVPTDHFYMNTLLKGWRKLIAIRTETDSRQLNPIHLNFHSVGRELYVRACRSEFLLPSTVPDLRACNVIFLGAVFTHFLADGQALLAGRRRVGHVAVLVRASQQTGRYRTDEAWIFNQCEWTRVQ